MSPVKLSDGFLLECLRCLLLQTFRSGARPLTDEGAHQSGPSTNAMRLPPPKLFNQWDHSSGGVGICSAISPSISRNRTCLILNLYSKLLSLVPGEV